MPESKRGRGRPRCEDEQALAQMAVLLVSKKVRWVREAAREALPLAEGGTSPESIEDRLRRNYKKQRNELEQWARQSLETPAPPRTVDERSASVAKAPRRLFTSSRSAVTSTSRDAAGIFRSSRHDAALAAFQEHMRQRDQLLRLAKGEPLEGEALAAFRRAIEGDD